jgi:hypothetical protein
MEAMLYAARITSAVTLALLPSCSVLFEAGDSTAARDAAQGDAAQGDANGIECYKDFPGCPNVVWQSFGDSCSCYLTNFNGNIGTPRPGHDLCKAIFDSHMLVIETESEQIDIFNNIDLTEDFHLGLFHSGTAWRWVTGENVGFSAFLGGGLPEPQGLNCGKFLINDGVWSREMCDEEIELVCELDGKAGTSPPPEL